MFIDLREGKHGPASTVPQAAVLAPVSLINSNRGELERFTLSICQAAKRAMSNVDAAANAAAERYGANTGADAAIVKAGLVASAVAWKVDIPEAPTMSWIKLMQDSNILKIQPKFNEIVDTSFSKNWKC